LTPRKKCEIPTPVEILNNDFLLHFFLRVLSLGSSVIASANLITSRNLVVIAITLDAVLTGKLELTGKANYPPRIALQRKVAEESWQE
jgi:hypothetical protein